MTKSRVLVLSTGHFSLPQHFLSVSLLVSSPVDVRNSDRKSDVSLDCGEQRGVLRNEVSTPLLGTRKSPRSLGFMEEMRMKRRIEMMFSVPSESMFFFLNLGPLLHSLFPTMGSPFELLSGHSYFRFPFVTELSICI